MKRILLVLLLAAPSLFGQKTSFASQSDLTADLSDALLSGIYHHRLSEASYSCERSGWLEGFGNFRRRNSSGQRSRYDNWFGGAIGGLNYALSCDSYLNFFVAGSWGEIDIPSESDFDTYSALFGTTWEYFCDDGSFFGLAAAGGFLSQNRQYSGVRENPRGVFFTPELTYAYPFNCFCSCPIFTSTLRYAGYFPKDYQHRQTTGTLYVKDRRLQLITLRGVLSSPVKLCCATFEPYLGIAGRFQVDGNHVKGKRVDTDERFSDGIDSSIGYGLLGLRFSKHQGYLDYQANLEWSYDTDSSWRILGELNLNYRY